LTVSFSKTLFRNICLKDISLRMYAETHVGLPMQFPLSLSDFIHKFERVYGVWYNMSYMRTDGQTNLLR